VKLPTCKESSAFLLAADVTNPESAFNKRARETYKDKHVK